MKKTLLPTISILTITYNPDITVFTRSLESIQRQQYPKQNIEHIVVDGGSGEESIRLMKRYGCNVIVRKELKLDGEARRSFAVKSAKNDIILWLESDNILEDADSLKKLVQPFMDDPKIISAFPIHYGYNREGSVLDRYSALFGGCDPVVFYLKKTDREPWYKNTYTKGKSIRNGKNYDVMEFNEATLPTVGDNGFLTRREALLRANISPEQYVHIDIYVDLLKLGYNRFAAVKSTAIEHIVGKSILILVKRRMVYAIRYSFSPDVINRRYFIYDSRNVQDTIRLALYIFYSLTFIQPLVLSLRGYRKIKDRAWFLHPIACFLFMLYYMKVTITVAIKAMKKL